MLTPSFPPPSPFLFASALLALKHCRLDREKLRLWRWWLGLPTFADPDLDLERAYLQHDWLVPSPPALAPGAPRAPRKATGCAAVPAPNGGATGIEAGAWGEGERRPRWGDVEALVEGRVSPIFALLPSCSSWVG